MPKKGSKKKGKKGKSKKRQRPQDKKMREGKQRAASAAASKNVTTYDESPGPPRGLVNLGNSCFLNSIIQNIARIRPVRDYFTAPAPPGEGPMTQAIRGVIRTMWRSDNASKSNKRGDSFSPSDLLNEIGRANTMFKGRQQHDSHEVFVLIIDTVCSEEVKRLKNANASVSPATSAISSSDVSGSEREVENGSSTEDTEDSKSADLVTIFDKILGGRIAQTMTCLECGYKSKRYEDFNHINLSMAARPAPEPTVEDEVSSSTSSGKRKGKKKGRKGGNAKAYTTASADSEDSSSSPHSSEELLPNPVFAEETSTALIVIPPMIGPLPESAAQPPPPPPPPPPPLPPRPLVSRIGPSPSNSLSHETSNFAELLQFQSLNLTSVGKSVLKKQEELSANVSFASDTEIVRKLSSQNFTSSVSKSANDDSDLDEPPMVPGDTVISLGPAPAPSDGEGFCDVSEDEDVPFHFSLFSDEEDNKSQNDNEKSTNSISAETKAPTTNKPTVGKVTQVGNAIMSFFAPKAPHGYKSIEGCLEDFTVVEKMEGSNSYACPGCTRKEKLRIAMNRAMKGTVTVKKKKRKPSSDEQDDESEKIASPNSLQGCVQTEFEENGLNSVAGGNGQASVEEVKLPPSNKESPVVTTSSPITTSASSLAGSDHVASDDDAESEKHFRPNKSPFPGNRDMTTEEEDELIKKTGTDDIPMVHSSATLQQLVADAPQSLVVQMKRFQQLAFAGRPRKISGHVDFPIDLDLTPFKDYDDEPPVKVHYTLTGLSVHMGSIHGGHYVAYVREKTEADDRGDWYYCSDTSVKKVSEKEVQKAEAYVLFYEKVSS